MQTTLQTDTILTMKYFIFDMDGTLIDSMPLWENLAHDYLVSKGVSDIPSTIAETVRTMSTEQAADYFIQDFGVKLSVEQICNELTSLVTDAYANTIPLKDGALDFLQKHAGKVKMCVATECFRNLSLLALERLGILHFFEFVLTAEEVGVGKRHSDALFIEAVKRMSGLECSNESETQSQELQDAIGHTIIFEDAPYAAKTAKQAGFRVIGVYDNSFRNHFAELEQYADQCVHYLNEVQL